MEKKKLHFEKLNPIHNADIEVYRDALDFVFKDSNIRNVAISGAYGAGKSSVLESYKSIHKEIKFVHISLAHFEDKNAGENSSKSTSILEGKVLNQLIHQIPIEKIPQTDFKVKKPFERWKIGLSVGLTLILIASICHITWYSSWSELVNNFPEGLLQRILQFTVSEYSQLVSRGIVFAALGFCAYYIILLQTNKNIFRKISFQGNEIEIFSESDESIFDKYLNEVLYLFESLEAEVVVFEDIDRYEVVEIFERLREINTLINFRRGATEKTLRFFYLLRDDIFVSKERTKFFDYIVPIIPVVDSSNSYDQLISHLEKNQLLEIFDKHFLQGISLYVDDMRLLKNICNEFLIYYKKLNSTELDPNKMFAMIVYKNLFPKDFSDLQLNRGYVYALFANKQQIIEDAKKELQMRLDEIIEKIDYVHNEGLSSQEELEDVYEAKKARVNSIGNWTLRNSEQKNLNEWYKNEYPKRESAIEAKAARKLEDLEREKLAIEKRITCLLNASLVYALAENKTDVFATVMTKNAVGTTETYKEVKENEYFDLLKYLLRNGYIDETFADYMTYFYGNSLTHTDKIFLRKVTDRKGKDYTYNLQSPQTVFERVHPLDFEKEEALNFSLLEYMLEYQLVSVQLNALIMQIVITKNFEFVSQFLDYTKFPELFVRCLNKCWPSLFSEILENHLVRQDQVKRFSILTLYELSEYDITAVNKDNCLTRYISRDDEYLAIESPKVDALIKAFVLLGVSFESLNYDVSNYELFKAVYEHGLYDLNYSNIHLMLCSMYHYSSDEAIRHKNFSLISKNIMSPLYNRVMNESSDYIDIIIENCNGIINDDEHHARELLNDENLSKEQKLAYLNCLKTPIENLRLITDQEIWVDLLKLAVLIVSEANIMAYFLYLGSVDSSLAQFINRGNSELDFSGYSVDQREKLFDALVESKDVDDIKYGQILSTLGFYFTDFDISGLSYQKVQVLINRNIIRMNKETLSFLREEYPECVQEYILSNLDEYVGLMNEELFSQDELLMVLELAESDTLKLKLLAFSEDEITIIGKNYTLPVLIHVLRNNLYKADMEKLFAGYANESVEVQSLIIEFAENDVSFTKKNIAKADDSLVERILQSNNLDETFKHELLVDLIPILDEERTIAYLEMVGLDSFVKVFDNRSRPRFSVDETSEKILSAFMSRGWISEYYEEEGRPGYYKIVRGGPPSSKAKKYFC